MDGPRFDSLVRSLAASGSRRHAIVSVILGGGSLLAGIADVLARGNKKSNDQKKRKRRDDERSAGDVAAEKRKRAKKHKKKGRHPNQDEAPPCTPESCPLPPGCSEQVLDDCSNALFDALLADAEPCRPSCEDDANSAACQECLQPIVTARLPEADACVVDSCSSATRSAAAERQRAKQRAGQVTAEALWTRLCEKPTCCFLDLAECEEDARDEYLIEMGSALASCFFLTTLVCLPAMLAAMARLGYQDQRCHVRWGCDKEGPYFGSCHRGDICCEDSFDFLCDGKCCHLPPGRHEDEVCCNGQCCADDEKCCGGECRELCNGSCCQPGERCDHTTSPPRCCLEERICGATCCTSEETCVGALPPSCCKTNKVCGAHCCGDDEICHPGVGGDSSVCCQAGRAPCGKGIFRFCCELGDSCSRSTDPERGSQCCVQGSTPCNGECCDTGDTCCPAGSDGSGESICCIEGRVCVFDFNGKPSCCDPGKTPCDGGCCGPELDAKCCFKETTGFYCCAPELNCCERSGRTCC